MLPSHVPLPHLYQLLDCLLRPLASWNWSLTRLDSAALHQAAIRKTGLNDFGDTFYRNGLNVLLDSVERDAGMHAYGRLVFHIMLVNYLSQRLYVVDAQKKQKDAFRTALNPPIIITGLPRSGTTFMHRLLSAHPRLMGIPYWRLFRPFPATRRLDLRKWQAWCELNLLRPVLSGLDVKHTLRAREPEEDLWLMGLTFHSPVFWILAPVAGYMRWFLDVDRTKAYEEYALLLHWFQSLAPSKTLVMKAPDHMPDLDKLLSFVPNAHVVQLHRYSKTCALSLSSLLYSTHRLFTCELHPQRIYDINRMLIEHYQEGNLRARRVSNVRQAIFDIDYEEAIADPVATIRRLSTHPGFEWLGWDEDFLKAVHNDRKLRRKPSHHYSAGKFGVGE